MVLLLVPLNYLLIVLFLNQYYLCYFLVVTIFFYTLHRMRYRVKRYDLGLYVFLFFGSILLVEYFDIYIFDIYLFLDLENIYTFVGGLIAYILSVLHSFIFFFSVFKKS